MNRAQAIERVATQIAEIVGEADFETLTGVKEISVTRADRARLRAAIHTIEARLRTMGGSR